MFSFKRLLPCLMLLLALSLALKPAAFSQVPTNNGDTDSKQDIQQQGSVVLKPAGPAELKKLEQAIPIEPKKSMMPARH